MLAMLLAPTVLASVLGSGLASGWAVASGPLPAAITAGSAPSAATTPLAPAVRSPSATTYRLRQTVRLREVAAGAKLARLWAPIPSDGPWQRISEVRVIDAPAGWRMEEQDAARGQLIYVEVPNPTGPIAVTIECTVTRSSVEADLSAGSDATAAIDAALFRDELNTHAPLMDASEEVTSMADAAVGGATDLRTKATLLLNAVADQADHYSKDPSKPHCGRGAASDCLANGGGCCTDLHSLFIAMARAEGIPSRLQFGYRLTPANEKKVDADPGYRCWVEYFLPGLGWVPTDIVVADSGEPAKRASAWGTLDDRRVWLWEGRGFTLKPAQTGGPIQTMIVGHAEVDGQAVDPLPAADGTPSKLERRITFEVLGSEKSPAPERRASAEPKQ